MPEQTVYGCGIDAHESSSSSSSTTTTVAPIYSCVSRHEELAYTASTRSMADVLPMCPLHQHQYHHHHDSLRVLELEGSLFSARNSLSKQKGCFCDTIFNEFIFINRFEWIRRRKNASLIHSSLLTLLLLVNSWTVTYGQVSAPPSLIPSPLPSTFPSPLPSSGPSNVASEFPTTLPTTMAPVFPSNHPSQSQFPSLDPTLTTFPSPSPSQSQVPSNRPTLSFRPSNMPSFSTIPSNIPSILPTTSTIPSVMPSSLPSDLPSDAPSWSPTIEPTFTMATTGSSRFRQKFTIDNGQRFNNEEILIFQMVFSSYTYEFGPRMGIFDSRINTTCTFDSQVGLNRRRLLRGGPENASTENSDALTSRELQTFQFIEVDYTMSFRSIHTNVSMYPMFFQSYVNGNRQKVTFDLSNSGLNVIETGSASRIFIAPAPSPEPTSAFIPSTLPSFEPSLSHVPSMYPSNSPSTRPTTSTFPPSNSPTTSHPTMQTPSPSIFPTESTEFPSNVPSELETLGSASPSMTPSTEPPVEMPVEVVVPKSGVDDTTVIVVCTVAAGSLALIALFVYYRRRKRQRETEFQRNAAGNRKPGRTETSPNNGSWDGDVHKPGAYDPAIPPSAFDQERYANGIPPVTDTGAGGMVSPSESLVSNQSLLSAGNSIAGDSGDEADATHNLADEFDQYKDQKLEKMRADVEGNLTGFDSMMSQALTKALMDDDESHVDQNELRWGGSGDQSGAEIEASALCEVMDWLKRKGNASVEAKRAFMQETLNKMVASVRHNYLHPDYASRSIHECAALLGLQLATQIPIPTLIVSGMRKTVTAVDMMEAFREFGDIAEAAVASNQRGFGILRFKTNKAVDRAVKKFRDEEIVVQDVAVQVKILNSGIVYPGGPGPGSAIPPNSRVGPN